MKAKKNENVTGRKLCACACEREGERGRDRARVCVCVWSKTIGQYQQQKYKLNEINMYIEKKYFLKKLTMSTM